MALSSFAAWLIATATVRAWWPKDGSSFMSRAHSGLDHEVQLTVVVHGCLAHGEAGDQGGARQDRPDRHAGEGRALRALDAAAALDGRADVLVHEPHALRREDPVLVDESETGLQLARR